jgi:hypothetical protein
MSNNPVILSFDVGVIHLAYCLLTKKQFTNPKDNSVYYDWVILDWNNIDLTNRDEQKCDCGMKASFSTNVNNVIKYYCKKHSKKLDTVCKPFEECFIKNDTDNKILCSNSTNNGSKCTKKSTVHRSIDNNDCFYCNVHAKQIYKSEENSSKLKSFKIKDSRTLNFDDVKYTLIMELEKRKNLLEANYVVIENQPSFKNPRMKSIACTIYDYYLIRGIVDKEITKSKIEHVKFMSPSNKLKLADDGDTKQLVKSKSDDKESKSYKLTKALGIKYCLEMTKHLTEMTKHFNSHKKKDDLADAFLQGAYYYITNIEPTFIKKVKVIKEKVIKEKVIKEKVAKEKKKPNIVIDL